MKAGGDIVIYKDTHRCTTSSDDITPIMEHRNFQLQMDGKTTIRGTLAYQPPGPHPDFCNATPDFIAPLAMDSENYIFLGDLNFHLHNTSNTNTANLLRSLNNIGHKQLVAEPTHIAGHALDPIFSANNRVKYSHAVEFFWTDHHCIHFTITGLPNTTANPSNDARHKGSKGCRWQFLHSGKFS